MLTFSDRLKELRKNKNLTQKNLGELIESNERVIKSYELGERNPTIDKLEILADYFNVSTDYLLGRSDNPMRQ